MANGSADAPQLLHLLAVRVLALPGRVEGAGQKIAPLNSHCEFRTAERRNQQIQQHTTRVQQREQENRDQGDAECDSSGSGHGENIAGVSQSGGVVTHWMTA